MIYDGGEDYSETIKQLKKELGLTNSDIAGFFSLTPISYANSSAKKRYEKALCMFYELMKTKIKQL